MSVVLGVKFSIGFSAAWIPGRGAARGVTLSWGIEIDDWEDNTYWGDDFYPFVCLLDGHWGQALMYWYYWYGSWTMSSWLRVQRFQCLVDVHFETQLACETVLQLKGCRPWNHRRLVASTWEGYVELRQRRQRGLGGVKRTRVHIKKKKRNRSGKRMRIVLPDLANKLTY